MEKLRETSEKVLFSEKRGAESSCVIDRLSDLGRSLAEHALRGLLDGFASSKLLLGVTTVVFPP